MSPESLIEKLEALGTIDPGILRKLRRRVENPEKSSSVNQILSFLVKHQHLTKDEALELKRNGADDVEPEPVDVRDEVDDLLLGVMEPEAEEPSPTAAEEDDLGFAEGEPDEDAAVEAVDDLPLVESPFPAAEPGYDPLDAPGAGVPVDEPELPETVLEEPAAYQEVEKYHDPMAEPLDEFTSVSHPAGRSKAGFAGKIDSRDQWATKWLFIGFGTLGLLIVGGTLLVFVLSLISAEDRFDAAMKSYEAGTYGDAIKKFDEFIEKHPSHENIPKARVTRVNALLAETYKQKNWDETIDRAERFLPELAADDSIDLEPLREDLQFMLPETTLAIARSATKQETKAALNEQLNDAKNAKKLVDNRVYIPNSRRKQATTANLLDAIDEEIAKGDGLIQKQEEFDSALVQIAAFRDRGETDKAFATYNTLIRSYGDLRANEQLQAQMRLVSQMEAELVKPFDATVTTQNSLRPSPIRSTIVLASKTGSPIPSLTGEIIPVLAGGSVYGIDVGDGSVKWRRFTGYQTTIQPLIVNPSTVLISDQTHHDLMLLKSTDGSVIWRNEIGEPFLDPRIDEENIYLTTEAGRLLRMDLGSGTISGAVQIPQNANVPMVRSERTGTLIQAGFYSNLYLLSEQDLSCRDVYYLGHHRGSISVPPVVWNNMILVAVNLSGVCDLHVLRPGEDGINLQLVQRIRRVTRGIVTNPLIRFGRFMLITSESGDLKILELDTAEETNPVRILAEEKYENRDGARAWLTTSGSQLWIGVRGIMRYKVSRALGVFNREQISNPDDFFVGPIHKFGDDIIHVRKRFGSALTSVSAVDAESLEQIWRTDLGGPLAGAPVVSGEQINAVSSQGDLFSFQLDGTTDQVASDEVKASNILENLLFDYSIALSPETSVCVGPPERTDILYVDTRQRASKLIRLPAPADKAASQPIVIAGHLIVPSLQGQVVRIDPTNGSIIGTPFLPPVSPGTMVDWKRPAALDAESFVIGAGSDFYLIDASDTSLLRKVAETAVEGRLKSSLSASDGLVFAIVSSGSSDKLVSLQAEPSSLQSGNSIDLEGVSQAGPWAVGGLVLVRMDNEQLVCFDVQLTKQWSVDLQPGPLSDTPQLNGSALRLYFEDGRVLTLNADSGEIQTEIQLGQPIVHLPVIADDKAIFAGRDGTVHTVDLSTN